MRWHSRLFTLSPFINSDKSINFLKIARKKKIIWEKERKVLILFHRKVKLLSFSSYIYISLVVLNAQVINKQSYISVWEYTRKNFSSSAGIFCEIRFTNLKKLCVLNYSKKINLTIMNNKISLIRFRKNSI